MIAMPFAGFILSDDEGWYNMQQASRVSDKTTFFNIAGTGEPGKLIEFDDTTTIFENPHVQATEDYISGRFG